MNHPDTLLAEYVDGGVAGAERRELEAHLATCARCRQEVALARAARSALRSAPPVVAPPGLGDAAIRTAAGAPTDLDRARDRRSPTRWIAAAAGVAAVVVLLAVASPKLGSSPSTIAAGAGAQSAGDASFAAASGVESIKANVDASQLAALAASVGGAQAPEAADNGASAAVQPPPSFGAVRADAAALPKATACLAHAWGDAPGSLTRLIAADYEGTASYFGFYAVGPGAGLAPTRIQLLVASVDGCRPLASSYALL